MTKKPTTTSAAKKPARSSTRAASTTPRAVRKTTKTPAKVAVAKVATPTAAAASDDRVTINKKELVERMVSETGMRKGDARRSLDATLSILCSVLNEGKDIAAAPLGKIKIARTKETANGKLAICRIKLKAPGTMAKTPVADPAE